MFYVIVFDGFWWYVCVFCFFDEVFKDFLFFWMIEICGCMESVVVFLEDRDWNEEVVLEIGFYFEFLVM